MYTVIDIINWRGRWITNHRMLLGQGEGVLIILDPAQILGKPYIPNNIVKILRPDKTVLELTVDEIEVNKSNHVALFFRDIYPAKIPRLSIISW